ncbi:hypothetical protein GHT06_006502 [Daphnia sinensis]|uniref:Uncharacterized protein n=1 Tax=Daphnia sinensis TaxID=1820382 RepID=A0AAD5KE83_9CRUS|nr:hypothetical protein GHT06_006502 [Daphnia sinensis]
MPPKEKELSRYLKRKLEVKEADFDLQLQMKEQIELSSINVRDVAGNEVQPQQQLSSSFESRPPEVFDLTYETCGNTGDTDIDIEASNADELFGNNTYEEDDMDDYIFMEGLKDCDRANYIALVCLAYKLKHRLSNAAFKDHLRILILFTGSTVEEMTSAAKCAEKYKKLIQPTKKVFICNEKDCDTVLNTGADGVPLASQPCGHRFSKEKKYCYFLVLSIEQQIQYLLESGAAKWFDSKQNCDGKTRGDIQTGDLYREKVRITDELIRYITLQLNTDGAECHKKSKFTFWAFMGIPNELPYFLRRSNILLFAIWYGNKKPPSGPFLEASISELQHLGTKGVQFNQRTYLVKPLILTTDSMARSVFLNGSTFRGECGCDFCLHPGEMIKIGRGSTRVYPEPTSNPTFAPRTVEQHERDLMTVLGTGKRLNGIKGPSPFLALLDFDYVQAQVPDYLHCVCHGGIKFLVALWTETKYFKQPWYLDERKTAILNARLMQMKPPYEITRTSSPLSDISQWKASNFRAFALYYFTALEDLLPKVYFDHFLCLIYGIQVLLQEEVTVNLVLDVDFLATLRS